MKSEERGFCGKCEEKYEPYQIFLCENEECFEAWYMAKQRFGYLCPECLEEFYDKINKPKAYAID